MLTPVPAAMVTVAAEVPFRELLNVAVIVVEPEATPVAMPAESMVATSVLEELHVTVEVTFAVLPLP